VPCSLVVKPPRLPPPRVRHTGALSDWAQRNSLCLGVWRWSRLELGIRPTRPAVPSTLDRLCVNESTTVTKTLVQTRMHFWPSSKGAHRPTRAGHPRSMCEVHGPPCGYTSSTASPSGGAPSTLTKTVKPALRKAGNEAVDPRGLMSIAP